MTNHAPHTHLVDLLNPDGADAIPATRAVQRVCRFPLTPPDQGAREGLDQVILSYSEEGSETGTVRWVFEPNQNAMFSPTQVIVSRSGLNHQPFRAALFQFEDGKAYPASAILTIETLMK